MRSRAALALFVIGTIALSPLPASAGGNWIDIRKKAKLGSYLVPGTKRVAYSSAYAEDPRRVRERGPYFAWLSPETFAWSPPSVDRAATVRLGRLDIDWDRMKASVSFTVPDVPAGDYVIAFCNSDCSHTFGDVDTTGGIRIFATAIEARVTSRLDKLGDAVALGRSKARSANRALRNRLERQIDDASAEVSNLDDRLGSLSTAVDGLTKATRPQLPSWLPVAVGLLAATAGFGVGRAHTEFTRRRAMDQELNELVGQR